MFCWQKEIHRTSPDIIHFKESHFHDLCYPEKFFQMKRSQCKDGLEIYKRFLTRMTRVSEFFKIAEVACRAHYITEEQLNVVLLGYCCIEMSLSIFTASGNWQKWHTWTHSGKTKAFFVVFKFVESAYRQNTSTYSSFLFVFYSTACSVNVYHSSIFFLLLCSSLLLLFENNHPFTRSLNAMLGKKRAVFPLCTFFLQTTSELIVLGDERTLCPPSLIPLRGADWSFRLSVLVVSSEHSASSGGRTT